MMINVRQMGKFTVLSPAEDVDVINFEDLDDAFSEQIALKKTNFILDFGTIRMIDSSGIAVIIKYLRLLLGSQGEIRLAGVNGNLRTIFSTINLSKYFKITNTLDEALK